MKKLAIIEMISISYEWGGIEQHVKDVSAGLVKNGHRVVVVCRDFKKHVDAYSQVCPVHTLPIRNSVDLPTIWGLAKIIKTEKIDIIHTHTSRDSWIALFASWIAGRGKIVTTRHVPLSAKRDVVHTWYFNQLAGIICVSEFVKNKFLGENPRIRTETVQVIYPGIKLDGNRVTTKRIIREKYGLNDDTFLIGFVGRITVEKGLDDLLKAVALLKKQYDHFKLIMVGEVNPVTPEYLEQLKLLAIELGIEEHIYYYGFSKDVASIMHDLDVLVLPSNIPETFGLVLCEAMLAGTPVISTNTGAQLEIIQDGILGFLVPPDSPDCIAEKLGVLINNSNLRVDMGQKAQKSIIERYSLVKMINELEQFFAAILAAKN